MIKLLIAFLMPLSSFALTGNSIKNESFTEGYAAYQANGKKKPAILIVHDWMGLGDFFRTKANDIAGQGYVAFAADIYGQGNLPKNSDEAGKLAGQYKSDRALLRKKIRAAYDKLLTLPDVDPKNIVVIGYCFGGTTALELARSGAPLAGTVTFHGGLSNPAPADAKNIKGQVLVLHGADDPFVPPAEVAAFKKEMADAKVKMQFIAYPGAVHAFTIPSAGNDNSKGAAYNAVADKKSWAEFQKFLKSVIR
jgi:dienelactone hydrolase